MEWDTVSIIAGSENGGFSGDGGLAINAKLNCPYGIAIHPDSGDIYIADRDNNRIRKITSMDGKISTIAGNGIEGFSGDGGLAINAKLNSPYGIAIHPDSGDIYIADRDNNKIRKITSLDGKISTVAGNTQFSSPEGIAIHHENGAIYITEYGNDRVQKSSLLVDTISTIAGNAGAGFSGDGGLATKSQLNCPHGIAIHLDSGDIYIADKSNNRIRKITSLDGKISTIAGNGVGGFSGDGGLAINAKLNCPHGIAIDQINGDIYISDYGNNRIRKISSLDRTISTVDSTVKSPKGIAIDPMNGDIYVCENHRILKFKNRSYFKIKKYDRDIIQGTINTCCKCIINIYCPNLFNLLNNEQLLEQLNANHQEIIQHLIDSLIYGGENATQVCNSWFKSYELIDDLFILGLIGPDDNFQCLTRIIIKEFMNSFTGVTCPKILEKLMKLKDQFSTYENSLLDQMITYSLEKAAELIKISDSYVDDSIFTKYIIQIAKKISIIKKSNITMQRADKSRTQKLSIESLFNDKTTSDILVKIGTNEYSCHKTILGSTSAVYEVLFNCGREFKDFKDNILTVDTNAFDEISQTIVLKYCYGIFDSKSISSLMIIPLFKCAHFHHVNTLSDYCVENLEITVDNYCTLVEQLGTDNETLLEKLIKFGVEESKQLFTNREILENLPVGLKNEIMFQYFSEQ